MSISAFVSVLVAVCAPSVVASEILMGKGEKDYSQDFECDLATGPINEKMYEAGLYRLSDKGGWKCTTLLNGQSIAGVYLDKIDGADCTEYGDACFLLPVCTRNLAPTENLCESAAQAINECLSADEEMPCEVFEVVAILLSEATSLIEDVCGKEFLNEMSQSTNATTTCGNSMTTVTSGNSTNTTTSANSTQSESTREGGDAPDSGALHEQLVYSWLKVLAVGLVWLWNY